MYGAKDGTLAIHSGHQYTLWALDEGAVPLTQICRQQPIHALHFRRDEELTFWIDLRHELTRTIALGCEWLEPIDRDEHTGLFLARINQLMLSAQTHELLKFNQEECHV
ncbi:MAG: hypothetical protein K2W33_04535 [Burkholderiales bacterium]|nr:hypothetical protein [Burkholderiales bacterium]